MDKEFHNSFCKFLLLFGQCDIDFGAALAHPMLQRNKVIAAAMKAYQLEEGYVFFRTYVSILRAHTGSRDSRHVLNEFGGDRERMRWELRNEKREVHQSKNSV